VRDRGTSTVEFAVVVPILLLLVFGIIDFGRMASDHVQLSAAARAAAQSYALDGNLSHAQTAANNVYQGGGTVSITNVTGCPAVPGVTSVATVTVSVTFKFVTPVATLAKLHNGQMTAQGAVPCRG
jgi:Flp pilus assembly protein TadG